MMCVLIFSPSDMINSFLSQIYAHDSRILISYASRVMLRISSRAVFSEKSMNSSLLIYLILIINIVSYLVMWFDKIAAIYHMQRIPEKTLWILSGCGGVFGVWMGMRYPLYHKAGKAQFRLWIPILCGVWGIITIYTISLTL